eukprot:g15613.t1
MRGDAWVFRVTLRKASRILNAMAAWQLESNTVTMGATLDSFDSNWENAQELLHGALCQNFQVDELCWEALLLAQGKGRRWQMACHSRVSPEDLETVPTAELITELRRRHDLLNRKPANDSTLLRQFFSKKGCYVGEVDATKRAEEVGSACIESVRARAHTAE